MVGRDQRADIILDHKLVSRKHAYIQIIDDDLFWMDLDSRSGTWSDGRSQKSGWLTGGKAVRIAQFEIQRFAGRGATPRDAGASPSPRVSPFLARSYGGQSLPEVALEFLNGPSRATCWPMNRVMSLVGSAEGNKFRLADPSVSPFHCSLLRTSIGLWVVDLLGSDGIAVNDVAVRFAMLADGDVLRVGRYRVRVQSRFAPLALESGRRPQGRRLPQADGRALAIGFDRPVKSEPGSPPDAPDPAAPAHVLDLSSSGTPPASRFGDISEIGGPSSDLDELNPLENLEIPTSVLMPFVNQFGSMQQQMMDQFQNAITMLVNMFGSLHQDQMRVIQEELNQLRDLTSEVSALKQEIRERSHARPGPRSASRLADPREGTETHAPRRRARQLPGLQGPGPARPRARVGPTEPDPEPPPTPVIPREVADEDDPGLNLPQDHASLADGELPFDGDDAGLTQGSTASTDRDSNRDVVVWLHQRMLTLQKERETRWQKILKLLPGVS
ncbi:MAG: FHA domain-containing protein [Isosphaeraceae bacterium]